jgi:hypothetical protein
LDLNQLHEDGRCAALFQAVNRGDVRMIQRAGLPFALELTMFAVGRHRVGEDLMAT